MKSKRTLAALIGGLLLLAGCGSNSGSTSQPAAGGASSAQKTTRVTLTLNWYPYGEHAPFYYGIKNGIFAKHGIDLTVKAGQGSGPTVNATAGDQTDFGWADTPALMAAVGKGTPVKSVGVFLQTTPASAQFFSSANINRPADLKGKTIATTAGDALSAVFPTFLKLNGLSASDVTLQNTDAAGKIAAVISGRTDALLGFAHDQGPTIANKSGKQVSYLRFADYGLNYYSTGLIASDQTIKNRPNLVKEMVAATSESFAAAVKDPTAAVAAMAGVSPQLPPQPVLQQSWGETAKILHTAATAQKAPGVNTDADWQKTIDVFSQAGMLTGSHKPGDFYNSSFAPAS